MEILAPQQFQITFPPNLQHLMTAAVPSKLSRPLLLRFTGTAFKQFATASAAAAPAKITVEPEVQTVPQPLTPAIVPNDRRRENGRGKKVGLDVNQLKLNWLKSLSCPLMDDCGNRTLEDSGSGGVDPGWVIGVDPDLSGALAVLRPDNSAQVFDSPHLKLMVGRKVRKRLDVRSIIELLQTVDAPTGTTVYLEQSTPFPQDGKQGWWSGGFGYGLWIGILVASGYSVVPVPSFLWKTEFKLSGSGLGKDDSRELASTLFPTLSSSLKRKKDHGRAEALLIAAYGKGLKVNNDSRQILDNLIP